MGRPAVVLSLFYRHHREQQRRHQRLSTTTTAITTIVAIVTAIIIIRAEIRIWWVFIDKERPTCQKCAAVDIHGAHT